MDKINSSIHNNPFASYYPGNHLEKERLVVEISQQLELLRDSTTSPYDELTKCLEIASHIMKGDKVLQTDLTFLAEKKPKL